MKYITEMQIFADYYSGRYSDSTMTQYKRAVKQFLTYVGKPMPRITEEEIEDWLINLIKNKYSQKTMLIKIRGLALFFNCFHDLGIIRNHALNQCMFKPRFQHSDVLDFNLRKLKKEYSR